MLRGRQLDERFLRHSEWVRRLGVASSAALAAIISFPLLVFVVLPVALTQFSGPSTLLSLLGTFLIVYLIVCHTIELTTAVPKNCVLYHFSFGCLGELPAFLIGSLSFLDALAVCSLILSAWSSHMNILFRRGIRPSFSIEILERQDDSQVLAADYDLFAALGVLFALTILCCSVKVVSTVSICFLCLTILVVASCTMVAFFHADPQNWIDAGFFKNGFAGLLRSAGILMVAYSGVDSVSTMVEETQKPRKRIPVLMVFLTFVLSVVFFLIIMIFSLSVNVSSLPSNILVPDIFTLLNIPAARYMLTVASICGLSGSVLASFLPASRILEAMTRDGLLPFPKDSSKKSPIFAMVSLSILICLSLLIRRDLLLDIVCTTTPLKHVATVCLTYLQHYLPEPLGLPQETSHYKNLNKRRPSPESGTVTASHSGYSVDTDVYVQMNIAAMETNRLQRRLEKEQLQKYEEEEPVLSHSQVPQYQSIPDRPSSGLSGLNHGHNCVAEACSPDDAAHIYCREVPEIPYVYSFNESLRTTSPTLMAAEFRKSCGILLLFLFTASAASFIGVWNQEHSALSIVLTVLFASLAIGSALMSIRVTPNDYFHRRENKVVLFPFISFVVLALLLLVLGAVPLHVWLALATWFISILVIYGVYSRWCSVHRGKKGAGAAISAVAEHEAGEEYRAIMGGEESTEIMAADLSAYVQKEENIQKLTEGKTKEIYTVKGHDDLVLIRSKNQLTAFNAARKDNLEGKGAIANKTTTHVFQYLQNLGMKTSFVSGVSDTEFLAKSCAMVPIEWVARRVATGSFLKRNPGVKEGFRFAEPKIETFFKDDANDDPQWSDEQMLMANFEFNGLKIGKPEIALMRKMTSTIFKLLEKGWAQNDCSLIDMKIEFGVTNEGEIVLSDVIDNDSWRVWPAGDRRLQLDKQFYRDMPEVTQDALKQLVKNYEKVMNLTDRFSAEPKARTLIIMGSGSDAKHCEKIAEACRKFGIIPVLRVNSAHKSTRDTLDVVAEYESDGVPTVVIAVAGRSNGLGPVIAGNSPLSVINCPPVGPDWAAQDIWSSLRTPSGLGCSTVLGTDEAALCAAKALAPLDHMVYGKVLVEQLNNYINIYKSDRKLNAAH